MSWESSPWSLCSRAGHLHLERNRFDLISTCPWLCTRPAGSAAASPRAALPGTGAGDRSAKSLIAGLEHSHPRVHGFGRPRQTPVLEGSLASG